MRMTVTIDGMSCLHCAMRVQKALEGVKGVRRVEVDLDKARASAEGEGFTGDDLKAAVEEAGYAAVRVEDAR